MGSSRTLKSATASLLFLALPLVAQAKPLGFSEAAKLVIKQVEHDRLYSLTAKCLRFQGEDEDAKFEYIVIRERHTDGCEGDPAVEPVVDRFIVNRRTGEIRWFSWEGENLPYEEVKKARSKLSKSKQK